MTESQPNYPKHLPGLHLIYASGQLPSPQADTLKARLAHSTVADHDAVTLKVAQQDSQKFLGEVAYEHHRLHIAGLSMPLPQDVIDRTVMVSPWQAQIKAAMRHHRSQISLVYAGSEPNPVEQMTALYTLAGALENEDLLGIVNINAWTAHPPADFLSPDSIAQYRQHIPFNLWFGYVRFYIDDYSYWLTTKGHHIFDVPDLAAFVGPGDDPNALVNLFINVFYYLYEQDVVVTAGDTLEISGSGQQLRFSEVTEFTDILIGPSGTLVIEKSDPPA